MGTRSASRKHNSWRVVAYEAPLCSLFVAAGLVTLFFATLYLRNAALLETTTVSSGAEGRFDQAYRWVKHLWWAIVGLHGVEAATVYTLSRRWRLTADDQALWAFQALCFGAPACYVFFVSAKPSRRYGLRPVAAAAAAAAARS